MDTGNWAILGALIYSWGMWYMTFTADYTPKFNWWEGWIKPVLKICFWPIFIWKSI